MNRTNAEFAKTDTKFLEWCRYAQVTNTKRQASKFRMKKGAAYRSQTCPDGVVPGVKREVVG